MGFPKFDYYAPENLDEALALLERHKGYARVMAGGTDLIIKMRRAVLAPKVIIGINKIPGLSDISFDMEKGLTIGAMTRLADVASHPDILSCYPAVAHAASVTGTVQVRNMGTVVGNLCNAAPSADNAPSLIAHGAEALLMSASGMRCLSLDEFFLGPGQTAMEPGELFVHVSVSPPDPSEGVSYQHISARGNVDLSAVGVAALVRTENGICTKARVVLGAVAPIPMRAVRTEALLEGKPITESLADEAGKCASQEAKPISDVRASEYYRREMVAVLTKRAVMEAAKRAGNS